MGHDPFAGFAETPYSQHSYQYGYANPASNSDPSGQVVLFYKGGWDDNSGQIDISSLPETQLLSYLGSRHPDIANNMWVMGATSGYNIGGIVPVPLNGIIDKGAQLVDEAYNSKCGSERIILIGYSRGGASVQQLAGVLNRRRPGMRIDLVVTIAPVDILHQNEPVSKSKLPNVGLHLNFRSGQGVAAQLPIGKDVNEVYPEPFPSLLASEFSVQGADGDVIVQKTSHFTILRNPMSRFEYRKPPPGTGEYIMPIQIMLIVPGSIMSKLTLYLTGCGNKWIQL